MRKKRSFRYKVEDDESGLVFRDNEVIERVDGLVVHKTQDEKPHPQLFIRAGDDPYPVKIIRKPQYPDPGVKYKTGTDEFDPYIENFTNFTSEPLQPLRFAQPEKEVDLLSGEEIVPPVRLRSPIGPASHLFLAGIGKMVVEDANPYIRFAVADAPALQVVYATAGQVVTTPGPVIYVTSTPGGGTVVDVSSGPSTVISHTVGEAIIQGETYRFEII